MISIMMDELARHAESDMYPFHMPGHKRQRVGFGYSTDSRDWLDEIVPYDITEIDGFDDLQSPKGMIADIECDLAELYGAKRAFLLVNGSTCGNLSAISALVPRAGRLLADKGAHRSVFNAAFIGGLELTYLERKEIPDIGLTANVSPEEIKQRLLEADASGKLPDAVLVTSPTYEGFMADVDQIAEIVHGYGVPLILDSAHGAHFTKDQDPVLPELSKEADITIVSLHKTLPALTQVSAMLVNGSIAEPDDVKKYINIFQTTSPSYILMASADRCVSIMRAYGSDIKKKLIANLDRLYSLNGSLKNLLLTGPEYAGKYGIFAYDKSKINIMDRTGGMSGQELYDIFRNEYHLQPEKADEKTCLMMTGVMDSGTGFERLFQAIKRIDDRIK